MSNKSSRLPVLRSGVNSFTLVELLVVMAIIAILAALVLSAASGLWQLAARKRAMAEIQAMASANENYKADNGVYVQGDGLLLTNTPYSKYDGTVSGDEYQTNSTLLFIALSGQTNYATPAVSGIKSYMQFKINQIGNPSATFSYIKDPWNASYAYSTGTPAGAATTNYPYTGGGFFDLWSTGGTTLGKLSGNASLTNAWISNWTQ